VNVEEIFECFPARILQSFQVNIRKTLYLAVSLYEMGLNVRSEQTATKILTLADVLLMEALEFGVYCYTKIDENFLYILADILEKGFVDYEVWHDCEDFIGAENLEKVGACKCSVAGNLLRFASTMGKTQQELVEKVFTECIKYVKFKEFMVVEFLKYIHFQYGDGANSTILNMKFQLFVNEKYQKIAYESAYFSNLVEVMRRSLLMKKEEGVDNIIWDVWNSLNYFLISESSITQRIIKDGVLMKDLLDLLVLFQGTFFYKGEMKVGVYEHDVNYKAINSGLVTEKAISQGLEKSIFLVCRLFSEDKISLLKNFALGCYLNIKLLNKTLSFGTQSSAPLTFNPGLQRVFCTLIKAYLGNNCNLGGVLKMLGEMLPGIEPREVSEEVIQGVLKTVGMVRYLHLMQNFRTGPLWLVYYFIPGVIFQRDIYLIQLMVMIADPKGIFGLIVRNFFCYDEELQKLFLKPDELVEEHQKERMLVIQDFLNFLVYLMQDETCALNLDMKSASFAAEGLKAGVEQKRVIKKMVINLLLGEYSTDLARIKSLCHALLLDKDQLDSVVSEVVTVDEKTHKMRIKDEYEGLYDPYMFYANPACQQNIANTMSGKNKSDKIDLVGGLEYNDLPKELHGVIQGNLFKSELAEFLAKFLIKTSNGMLIRPMLKLVLMNLQVSEKDESIREKVEKLYMKEEFMKKLRVIAEDEDLKDCKICVEKIQKILKYNQSEKSEEKKEEDQQKKLAKERMNKLKEEFARKQALFANKLAVGEEVKVEESKHSCQHCLEDIDGEKDQYGLPIYVSFTNNFYNGEEGQIFEKQDYQDLKNNKNWWPVVSSCNHYYHKKCFELVYKNSRRPNEMMQGLFSNKFETCCSLCKTICNSFLLANGGDSGREVVENVQGVLKCLVERLNSFVMVNHQQAQQEDEEEPKTVVVEIFKRAHFYFVESFSLFKQPSVFEKSFTMFVHFLKSFRDCLKNELSCEIENISEILIEGFNPNVTLDQVMKKHLQMTKDHLGSLLSLDKEDKMFMIKKIALGITLTEAVLSPSIPQNKIHNLCQILFKPDDESDIDQFILRDLNLEKFLESTGDLKIKKYAPRMLKLPGNYEEFNKRYFLKKCKLCETYCKHLYRSICLICGEVFL